LPVEPLLDLIQSPTAGRMLQPVEGRAGVLYPVQMDLQSLADMEAFGPSSHFGEPVEPVSQGIGYAHGQHEGTSDSLSYKAYAFFDSSSAGFLPPSEPWVREDSHPRLH
jgi:hypothetical protein